MHTLLSYFITKLQLKGNIQELKKPKRVLALNYHLHLTYDYSIEFSKNRNLKYFKFRFKSQFGFKP
jgi:hypothetical protein